MKEKNIEEINATSNKEDVIKELEKDLQILEREML